MSTSINVHTAMGTDEMVEGGKLKLHAKLDSWPRSIKLDYEQGGPGIEANHSTCFFVGAVSGEAIRSLAGDAARVSEQLFQYANWLDENPNDSLEGGRR